MKPTRATRWLTGGQAGWIVIQFVIVIVLFGLSWTMYPDSMRLLWEDPAGIRMALTAVACFAIAVGGFAGACVLLNRRFPPAEPSATGSRRTGLVSVAFVLMLIFMAPVVF